MFQLNYQSHKSIYEQIVDNIKEQIITGVLKENTQLPTVRELSQLLTINPHIVQKAFQTLEKPETFNQSQIHRIQSSRIQNKLLTDGNIN